MKNLFLIGMFISQFSGYTQAEQIKYPEGAYLSFEELVNKAPSRQLNLQIAKRTRSDIAIAGGNDYKLVTEDKSIKRSVLRKEILAWSTGDTLYLNCLPYKVQPGYAKVISDGDLLVIKAGISSNPKEYKEQMQSAAVFGATVGALAGVQLDLIRFVYAIDKKTNKITRINDQAMRQILAPKPELLNLYEEDANKNGQETLIRYLKRFNEES